MNLYDDDNEYDDYEQEEDELDDNDIEEEEGKICWLNHCVF